MHKECISRSLGLGWSNPRLFCIPAQGGAGAVVQAGPGDQSQEVTVTLLRSRVVAEFQLLLGPSTQPGHPACIHPAGGLQRQYSPLWRRTQYICEGEESIPAILRWVLKVK